MPARPITRVRLMPIRTLVHRQTEWTIWNVVPSLENRLRIPLAGRTGGGWLCFQSVAEKRRVVPVPEGWEEWPDDRLASLLEEAVVVAAAPQLTRIQERESRERSNALAEQMDVSARRARHLRDVARAEELDHEGEWVERPDPDDPR